MSWTEDQLDRLRDKLVLAKRQGVWISAAEIWIVIRLIQFWRRATMRKGWNGPIDGLPPTVADTRAQGITHVYVTCGNTACFGHSRRLALDALHMPGRQPIPDSVTFMDLPNLCRFRCVKCGSRHVTIMADWPQRSHFSTSTHSSGSAPFPIVEPPIDDGVGD